MPAHDGTAKKSVDLRSNGEPLKFIEQGSDTTSLML